MFEYKSERRYVLMEKEGVPAFILAETVGIEIGQETRDESGVLVGLPYSDLDSEAAELQIGDRIVGREELEANPEWADALRRWEARDDLVYAEWERRRLARCLDEDEQDRQEGSFARNFGDEESPSKRLAEEARAHGSLLPA